MASRFRRISGAIRRRKDDNKTDAVATGAAKDGSSTTQMPLSDASKLQNYYDQRNGRIQVGIAVLGTPGVGRTCFLRHWSHGLYTPGSVDHEDAGIYRKQMSQPYGIATVELTRSEEHLYRLPLIEAADCYDLVIMTYNVGDRKSFDGMGSIYEQSVLKRRTRGKPVWQGVMVIALAHDLAGQPNAVDSQLGRDFARARGFSFRELSTKSGYGCTYEDYSALVTDLVRQQIAGDDITKLRRYLETPITSLMVNVAVLGARGIGKSSFVRRLNHDNFSAEVTSEPSDHAVRQLDVLGGSCTLQFNTHRNDSDAGISTEVPFRDNFVVIMYNAGDRQSYYDMQKAYDQSIVQRQQSNRPEPWYGTMVVALASDLADQPDAVGIESGRIYASSRGMNFHATSAKTGVGCTEADFAALVTELLLQQMARDKMDRLRRYHRTMARPVPRIHLLTLGDPGIGKKTFIRALMGLGYSPGYDPTTMEYGENAKLVDGIVFVYLPTASKLSDPPNWRFNKLDYVIMAYNVSSPQSFYSMQRLYDRSVLLREKLGPWHGAMVVALASDFAGQPDSVTAQQGMDYAASKSMSFRETSAKTGQGCSYVDFNALIQDLLLQRVETMADGR